MYNQPSQHRRRASHKRFNATAGQVQAVQRGACRQCHRATGRPVTTGMTARAHDPRALHQTTAAGPVFRCDRVHRAHGRYQYGCIDVTPMIAYAQSGKQPPCTRSDAMLQQAHGCACRDKEAKRAQGALPVLPWAGDRGVTNRHHRTHTHW
jgi:hypothetical protein